MAELFRRRNIRIFLFAVLCVLTVADAVFTNRYYRELDAQEIRIVVLDCVGMILSLVLLLSLLRGRQEREEDVWFRLLIDVNIVYLFADGIFWLIDGRVEFRWLNLFTNTLYCALPICLSWLFWKFLGAWSHSAGYMILKGKWIGSKTVSHLAAGITLAGVIFVTGNLAGGYLFTVPPGTGLYQRAPAVEYLMLISSAILVLCFLRILLTDMPVADKLTLMIYPLLPYLNTLATIHYTGPTLLAFLTFCSMFFFYTNLYLRRREELELQRMNYARQRRELLIQKEKLAVSEKELTQSRINGMLLQISPHFIYNTLGTIDSLCEEDPARAQQLIRKFSHYLRNNYQDLTREPMIPFREELEHLKLYLSIEQERFPNLKTEYEIHVDDFRIPSQSIQPLVENAVRHGIGKRRHSEGTIAVTSGENEAEWIVTVQDNGVGFAQETSMNASKLQFPDDSSRHIGIGNVAKRIDILCGGSLHIHSTPGVGTICTIRLPKKNTEGEDI